MINGIQGDEKGYSRALSLLRARFGSTEHLRAAHLHALRSLPHVTENNGQSFQNFVDVTRAHLVALSEFCNSFAMAADIIQELLD